MNPTKYNKANEALKALERSNQLHPLRQAALKTQLLEQIAQEGLKPAIVDKRFLWGSYSLKPMTTFIATIVSILIAGTAAFATETSMPGDILHPIKLATEKIELRLAANSETKATIEARQASERLEELNRLRAKALAEQKFEVRTRLEDRSKSAEDSTTVRVENALNVLGAVRTDLEAKGNTRAVQAVDSAIERLKNRATQSRLKIELEREHGDIKVKVEDEDSRDDDSDDRSPSTTTVPSTSTETKIEVKDNGEIEIEVENEDNEDDDDDSRNRRGRDN